MAVAVDYAPRVTRLLSEIQAIVGGGLITLERIALGVDGTILGERRAARFFSHNDGVPALVVSVGPWERMADVLPRLRALSGRHVITLERVRVVRRDGRVPAELPAPPAHDQDGLALWQRVTSSRRAGALGGLPLCSQLIRRLREANAAGAGRSRLPGRG